MSEIRLRSHFITFCNFGVGRAGKTTLTDKNLTKMFRDCKLYGKALTSTDTDISFCKVKKKGKKEINFEEFKALLRDVSAKFSKDEKLGSNDAAYKALIFGIISGGPSLEGTTGVSATGAVDRMTDHTIYTGSHKNRFDEHGRGKGIDERINSSEFSGYVGNYKGSGTYDKRLSYQLPSDDLVKKK